MDDQQPEVQRQLDLFGEEPEASTPSADAAEYAEPVEAYCVRCRQMVDMLDGEPVWTSKGTPGTRGTCPNCGTTVFRLGKMPAHDHINRPTAVRVGSSVKVALDGKRKRMLPATYINYDPADAEFAEKLAEDLENAGVHTWIDISETAGEEVNWAGGVHPALKDSARMVVILSPQSIAAEKLTAEWTFFRTQKKPIAVVLLGGVTVPDQLRRSPRFDFSTQYKTNFRQLIAALSD
ncbi:MAG: toll/interleukin-1 receptor domain-containing protein [Anaerolineae bacterium]|nr:toll/interleukin-1 receptor domain-containing protein [Anaerolineae bacterium]